jgi:hypothetical protein
MTRARRRQAHSPAVLVLAGIVLAVLGSAVLRAIGPLVLVAAAAGGAYLLGKRSKRNGQRGRQGAPVASGRSTAPVYVPQSSYAAPAAAQRPAAPPVAAAPVPAAVPRLAVVRSPEEELRAQLRKRADQVSKRIDPTAPAAG